MMVIYKVIDLETGDTSQITEGSFVYNGQTFLGGHLVPQAGGTFEVVSQDPPPFEGNFSLKTTVPATGVTRRA
ncbi:unnamed protein product, partial [marine sediment metagenome]